MKLFVMRHRPLVVFGALLLGGAQILLAAESGYRTPSPALAAIVDAPLSPAAILSLDRRTLLLLDRPDSPSIATLAQPEVRLAGLRINPATNGPSRSLSYTGAAFKSIDSGQTVRVSGLPTGARIGDHAWCPDSRHLALTLVREHGIELWLVNVGDGGARQLTGPVLNAMFGEPVSWLDAETLAIRRVPANRAPAPAASLTP